MISITKSQPTDDMNFCDLLQGEFFKFSPPSENDERIYMKVCSGSALRVTKNGEIDLNTTRFGDDTRITKTNVKFVVKPKTEITRRKSRVNNTLTLLMDNPATTCMFKDIKTKSAFIYSDCLYIVDADRSMYRFDHRGAERRSMAGINGEAEVKLIDLEIII